MKPRERNLLIAFFAILVFVGGFIEWSLYSSKRKDLLEARRQLDLSWLEIEGLLQERDLWLGRAAWLKEHQPAFPGRKEADKTVFDLATAADGDSAETSGLQFITPTDNAHYAQAGVSFQVKGAVPSTFGWLYKLQGPEEFRVIRRLTVEPDKEEPANIVCQVELLHWYAAIDASGEPVENEN